jgi:hypothetical protein
MNDNKENRSTAPTPELLATIGAIQTHTVRQVFAEGLALPAELSAEERATALAKIEVTAVAASNAELEKLL